MVLHKVKTLLYLCSNKGAQGQPIFIMGIGIKYELLRMGNVT